MLKNGASVLARFSGSRRSVVLAIWEKNEHSEYITWMCDNDGNTEDGNYFYTLHGGIEDFRKRIALELDNLLLSRYT